MRRLVIALLVSGALAALARRRRATSNSLLQVDPRADDLKRKLAEAREAAADRDAYEGAEVPVDQAEWSVEERRREVHEAARGVIEGRTQPEG